MLQRSPVSLRHLRAKNPGFVIGHRSKFLTSQASQFSCKGSAPVTRVLLIDDDLNEAYLLQQILNQSSSMSGSFQAIHSPDMIAAQSYLKSNPVDLLIVSLSDNHDRHTIEHLQHLAPQIPLIVVGPQSQEQLGVELIHAGIQDYLVKTDLSPNMLARAIRYAQERHATEQTLWRKAERERLVIQITQHIHQSLDLDTILNTTVTEIRQFLQADRVAIYRFQPNFAGKMINESVVAPWPSVLGDVIHDHCFSESYVDRYRLGRIQVIGNVSTANLHPCHRELLESYDIQANLVIPIVVEAKLWGLIISHQCSHPREWDTEEVNLVRQLSTQVAIAIHQAELYNQLQLELGERKDMENRLRYQALHDSLTKLPNRELLTQHLSKIMQRAQQYPQEQYAVLCIDLDRFKTFNDSLGHPVGDVFLQEISQRLRHAISPQDFVARLGGDEFVIVLDQLRDQTQAENITQYLLDRLATPFHINQYHLHTTASIGLVMGRPDYKAPEELLRDADTAMYRAKGLGKNCFEIFNPTMYEEISQRLNLELEMWQAVEHGDFTLAYQPIFHLRSKKLVGFETLLRWPHSTKGAISPEDFIPIAEETGLIIPLGTWTLQTACQQLHQWIQARPDLFRHPINLSVNLSSKQFSQTNLVDQISKIVQANKIPGNWLKLEITESVLMEYLQSAREMLQQLKQHGIQVVIDDFGTGYSSLSYLSHLPLDGIKIDRSFVQNMDKTPENLEVVDAIISLAQILKLDVVAEGIETEAQLAMLTKLECSHGQGYWYSPPMPAELVLPFMERHCS